MHFLIIFPLIHNLCCLIKFIFTYHIFIILRMTGAQVALGALTINDAVDPPKKIQMLSPPTDNTPTNPAEYNMEELPCLDLPPLQMSFMVP